MPIAEAEMLPGFRGRKFPVPFEFTLLTAEVPAMFSGGTGAEAADGPGNEV